ncbi:MAG TPA: di-heme oxidoredictase family protein [Vicinamibacterales bacterium]|nr:di-heme oxidoredictase family protein [Vicinamibacterales bacterium]
MTVLTVAASCLALAVVHSQGPQFNVHQSNATEAPAGFDNVFNGFGTQGDFDAGREAFEERDGIGDGLGPVYNAQSCAECHQSPVTGAISQITELRAGHLDGRGNFIDHPGGSLIHSRATDAAIVEQLLPGNPIRSFRTSLNTLGDGFVEAIDDATLRAISNNQPFGMQGQVITVPLLEAGGQRRVGRFGWKNQHASLLSFSADAYLNEVGITSPLLATENTSNGRPVVAFDPAPDPEDNGEDIAAFAQFMRATKAPPRDAALSATPEAQAGEALFAVLGCATCHVTTITTAPAGTIINGGTFTVPAALGNKIIHPYSDFLLHDVGTGDGIVQNGGQSTRNKLRTPPLWGLRTHNRFMHDGESLTVNAAILRHDNEAANVIRRYRNLGGQQVINLLTFLMSL